MLICQPAKIVMKNYINNSIWHIIFLLMTAKWILEVWLLKYYGLDLIISVNPKTCIQIVPYFRHIYQKFETLMLLFMY